MTDQKKPRRFWIDHNLVRPIDPTSPEYFMASDVYFDTGIPVIEVMPVATLEEIAYKGSENAQRASNTDGWTKLISKDAYICGYRQALRDMGHDI